MVAVAHSNRKDQRGHEPNDYRGDESSRHRYCRVRALLRQVNRTVQAGEYKVGVDEAGEEDNTVGRPARGVDEFSPYKVAALFRVRLGEAGDCDHEEGYKREEDCVDDITQGQ